MLLAVRTAVIVLIVVVIPGAVRALAATPVDADRGALVVFLQPQALASPLDLDFRRDHLPPLRDLAEEMDIPVRVIEIDGGAPEAVTITPLIVYQNYRGRSIYQGRFATPGRIRNFIRTSRFAPQQEARLELADTAVWRVGRAQIGAPLKVLPPTGHPPADYDSLAFAREAADAIARGFERFRMTSNPRLGRGDRLFYMDFYPWASEDGNLYLSVSLFSQFHCEKPVFENRDDPLSGPWNERERLFSEAATLLEAAVARQLEDAVLGDGFDPVDTSLPVVSWESLDLALPPAPAGDRVQVQTAPPLQARWTVADPGPGDPPPLQFRFPAPLDHYRGTVEEVEGALELQAIPSLDGARGWVEAVTRSVGMGLADLDSTIHTKPFLSVAEFPRARFELESVRTDGLPLAYGRLASATVSGTFTMRGRSVPVSLRVSLEPVLAADGTARLLAGGAFRIRLAGPFGMLGADGPSPQSDTVIITVNLALQPKRS